MDRERIKKVLIHQVGDSRQCPSCQAVFVPKDQTSRDAMEMYKELNCNSKQADTLKKETHEMTIGMETRIDIFTKKAQCSIWRRLETGFTNNDWEGKIEGIDDVVISRPDCENLHINRWLDFDRVNLSDGLFLSSSLPDLNKYIEHVTRLVVLVVNEELRVECPKKFAGAVICEDLDTLEFSFIYGFGN